MEARVLAHTYVVMDRNVFDQLLCSSLLPELFERVKDRLRAYGAFKDFEELSKAGAEDDEILWILAGSEGLPGLRTIQEVFGWSPEQWKKGLDAIELGASFMEKTGHYPFGILADSASVGFTDLTERLRFYVRLARAAQRDFGYGTEWFLNIAKARLVIHVCYRANGNPHDREVSGLIAALTGSDYNAGAQKRWRDKHRELVEDHWLDPYTIQTDVEREQNRRQMHEIAAEHPSVAQTIKRSISGLMRMYQLRSPRNR